jgi:hypothetical protein
LQAIFCPGGLQQMVQTTVKKKLKGKSLYRLRTATIESKNGNGFPENSAQHALKFCKLSKMPLRSTITKNFSGMPAQVHVY